MEKEETWKTYLLILGGIIAAALLAVLLEILNLPTTFWVFVLITSIWSWNSQRKEIAKLKNNWNFCSDLLKKTRSVLTEEQKVDLEKKLSKSVED